MEMLEGLLKDYEISLKSTKTIEQRWRRYTDPKNENRQLELYKCLLVATQALVEKINQPPIPTLKQLLPKELKKDVELEIPQRTPTMEMEVPLVIPSHLNASRKYPTSHVPKLVDENVNQLWEELKTTKIESV